MDLRTGNGVREHRISFLSRAWTATTAARQDEQRCARGPALEPGVDWTIYLLSAWEFGVAKGGLVGSGTRTVRDCLLVVLEDMRNAKNSRFLTFIASLCDFWARVVVNEGSLTRKSNTKQNTSDTPAGQSLN